MFFLARGDAQATYLVLNVRDEGVFFLPQEMEPVFFYFKSAFEKKNYLLQINIF
jgi:hypothetical protein